MFPFAGSHCGSFTTMAALSRSDTLEVQVADVITESISFQRADTHCSIHKPLWFSAAVCGAVGVTDPDIDPQPSVSSCLSHQTLRTLDTHKHHCVAVCKLKMSYKASNDS